MRQNDAVIIGKNIRVDAGGKGDFTTIQQAINSVPSHNLIWTRIYLTPGTYNEKVVVPADKQFIFLQGESRRTTVIQWGDYGDSVQSSTFILNADNFVAVGITFQNTYNLGVAKPITWAPAATIYSDKVSFHECGFVGVQDTLTDALGRHYYKACYIEGATDFIWGQAQSFFEKCSINATTGKLNGGAGYITAQGREDEKKTDGFVFVFCSIFGTGPVYLGRAYKAYSTVLFYRSFMSGSIVPDGWSAWEYVGHEDKITFAEENCEGAGANKSKRVQWEKKLPFQQLKFFVNINSFINYDGWIQNQPH
ncbi:Pectin lyase-like superfamily protein [Euphorbia peplus]|nr:Pectin lyase-like superfamily protein [Euphorbia peplus]